MHISLLTHKDLEPVLLTHSGNSTFAQSLNQAATDEQFVALLGKYIHFNSVFGGGVANLAGEIAVRQDLFRDSTETVALLADRSVEVAADIFFAAVDEFDDRSTPYRDTHRTLAQATLKGTGEFYGLTGEALNQTITPGDKTISAMDAVRIGYGLNKAMQTADIFRAIGFHAGSEILADREFVILDEYLKTNRPDLVENLKQKNVQINDHLHNCYFWIMIHTSVEADHFAFAAKGANRALQYYTGPESEEDKKRWLIEGFANFADVQAEFMMSLCSN